MSNTGAQSQAGSSSECSVTATIDAVALHWGNQESRAPLFHFLYRSTFLLSSGGRTRFQGFCVMTESQQQCVLPEASLCHVGSKAERKRVPGCHRGL